jgi:2-oxoisovalerate dehydrogenase E2 component (dihydrolipoyl transacylase)
LGKYVFRLPDVGEGIAEAEIVAWHVKPGDQVQEDQPLVDVMTDKATVEITSPVSGAVVSIEGDLGFTAAIGSTLVVLEVEGAGNATASPGPVVAAAEPAPTPVEPELVKAAPREQPVPRAAEPAVAVQVSPRIPGLRPLASPAVRQRALDLGVRLELVKGTGPAGRITRKDLEGFKEPAVGAPGRTGFAERDSIETIKVIGLRRRIAEKMSEAKRYIPHFSYIEEIDVTELEALRAQLNALHKDRDRLTVLPFLARALIVALEDFPQINATFDDTAGVVSRLGAVHLGVATQTPGGLVVPVVRHAEALDLWRTGAEILRLANAARAGKAKSEELTGSTITITSLGALGGLATTPVINRPEVAIVGPNKIIERPMVIGGAIVVRKMMNLSSSFDHRVVDGWDAAEFVQRLRRLLETPALMFVERP